MWRTGSSPSTAPILTSSRRSQQQDSLPRWIVAIQRIKVMNTKSPYVLPLLKDAQLPGADLPDEPSTLVSLGQSSSALSCRQMSKTSNLASRRHLFADS